MAGEPSENGKVSQLKATNNVIYYTVCQYKANRYVDKSRYISKSLQGTFVFCLRSNDQSSPPAALSLDGK